MDTLKRMKPLLGTFVEIGTSHQAQSEPAIKAAFQSIETLQNQMSFHNPNSALSQLNGSQGQWVELPNDTLEVLQRAVQLQKQTQGLFNCTVGGYLVEKNKLPSHCKHPFMHCGKPDDIEFRPQQARLKKPLLITLDGIAKGYAVDHAIAVLQTHQITSGWVNAGGDLRVFGDIKLPIHQRSGNRLAPLVTLCNHALSTSQISQENPYDFPSYIVNQQGQQPNDCTISIMAKQAWLSDALTKVIAQVPESERAELAKQFNAQYVTTPTPDSTR